MHQHPTDLVAYLDTALGHHCTLCFFLENDAQHCPHKNGQNITTQQTDNERRAAEDKRSYSSSIHSADQFTVVHSSISSASPRELKRKVSPKRSTLREMSTEHSRGESSPPPPRDRERERVVSQQKEAQARLRAQRSEDLLRRCYEVQTLRYLEDPISEMSPFRGRGEGVGAFI